MGEIILSVTYVICFSGGLSSALCAVETVKLYGKDNCILLNHDISSKVEHSSVKRFKNEIAKALGMEITYANADNFEMRTPLKVAIEKGSFAYQPGKQLCTYELKTKPFHKWLAKNFPVKKGKVRDDVVIVYGFDAKETERIQRRKAIMQEMGYRTLYPLAERERTIFDTREIGVEPPSVYDTFLHANCVGCLKAGIRSWYVCYCIRRDVFDEAVAAEQILGRSILKQCYLKELVPEFEQMRAARIEPTDRGSSHLFWKTVHSLVPRQKSLMDYFDEDCPCQRLS